MNATPIVKWAGGKRQLIEELKKYMPEEYKRYYEPFVGGGALFLCLMPKNAVINDINEELISIYKSIKNEDDLELLKKQLKKFENSHSDEYYYIVRAMDREKDYTNKPIWFRAARTIYLNKACWNGLYRVSSQGFFNVPSGKKETVHTYEEENFNVIHDYLSSNNVSILCGSYKDAVKDAKEGDFVYFDPPYDVLDGKPSFTSYSKDDFNKENQKELRDLFVSLSNKGIKCMLSNSNTNYINELYEGFNIYLVDARRSINSKGDGRGKVKEVVITNY